MELINEVLGSARGTDSGAFQIAVSRCAFLVQVGAARVVRVVVLVATQA